MRKFKVKSSPVYDYVAKGKKHPTLGLTFKELHTLEAHV